MRDALEKARWWNNPVRNKTQTKYMRFLRSPEADLTSSFTDAIEEFENFMKQRKTVYQKYMGDI